MGGGPSIGHILNQAKLVGSDLATDPRKESPMKPPTRPEEDEQRAVAQYLDMRRDLVWCHVPNGGLRNAIVAKKLKAQGVKPGVPDILIFDPTRRGKHSDGEFVGCAIELKRRVGGRVSDAQDDWIIKLTQRGWICTVCFGSDEAIDFIESMYGMFGMRQTKVGL